MTRKQVHLVQRGMWDLETASMPLAMGYLKAILRHVYKPLQVWAGIGQVELLHSLDAWADMHLEPRITGWLRDTRVRAIPPPAALLESTDSHAASRPHALRVR